MYSRQWLFLLLLSLPPYVHTFSVVPATSSRRATITTTARRYATTESSTTTETIDREGIFKEIGIPEDKLALGIRPQEFLKYVGSREDLVVKTMNDIPALDRSKAEIEVDKFLLDAEMINIYIQYGKEIERDPNFKVPEARKDEEGLFSLRNVVILYIIFIASTTIPDYFRNYVADQQVAGEWTATGFGLLDHWIEETSPAAMAAAMERAAAAVSADDATASVAADSIAALPVPADAVVETVAP